MAEPRNPQKPYTLLLEFSEALHAVAPSSAISKLKLAEDHVRVATLQSHSAGHILDQL